MPILLYLIPIVGIFFIFNSFRNKKADTSGFFIGNDKNNGLPENGYSAPVITGSKAESVSSILYNEMSSLFTSESKIIAELSKLTEADYILVFNAFGLKKYLNYGLTGGSGGIDVPFFGTEMNLTEWINKEVTQTSNREKLSSLFPNLF